MMPAALRITLFLVLPIALIAAGTVAGVLVMHANQPEAETSDAPRKGLSVFVETAAREDVTLTVQTHGEARPRREIDLVPQVSGRIVEVADSFIEGGIFQAGDVLVRIEDADYRLAVTRAEASVAQAERTLQREQAEADIAKRDWAELGAGDASPLALREPQLAEARANLAAARASLAEARLQLERASIAAPFDGRLRAKSADLGQYVAPGQPIAEVFSTDVMEIRLPLSDRELARLGLPVAFTASADAPGPQVTLSARLAGVTRTWTGHIARTDSALEARTRSLFATAEVVDPYGAGADDGAPLPAGLFVEAVIAGREVPSAFVLPRAALRGADQVYVAAKDGRMEIRTVHVVASDRRQVVLTSGVDERDWVITSPVLSAEAGMALEVFTPGGDLLFSATEDPPAEEADAEIAPEIAGTAEAAGETL
ncbi:MAG: efflux RND transporter periplasmic adaptor subunit [Caulobacterales bacterium]|nr:efflux RND transporter periplasmic adaptor subunit [Caulobacterales bacterium]